MSHANDPLSPGSGANYAPLGGAPAGVPAEAPTQETTPGVRPPGERDQDEARSDMERGLASDPARPLSDEEREAARADAGVPPRVYAPASERVPKAPLPGHEDLAGHVDPTTPERQAVSDGQASSSGESPSAD